MLPSEEPKAEPLDPERARAIDDLLAEDRFPKRKASSAEPDDVEALLAREDRKLELKEEGESDKPEPESLQSPPPIEMRGSPDVHAAGTLMGDPGSPKPAHDAVPGLLEALGSMDAKTRSRAADELGKLGPKAASAVEPLRGLLRDSSARVRSSAILALGNIGPAASASVKDIVKALRDPSAAVRYSAALALSRIDTPAAKKAFSRYLRKEALRSLQPARL